MQEEPYRLQGGGAGGPRRAHLHGRVARGSLLPVSAASWQPDVRHQPPQEAERPAYGSYSQREGPGALLWGGWRLRMMWADELMRSGA